MGIALIMSLHAIVQNTEVFLKDVLLSKDVFYQNTVLKKIKKLTLILYY